MNGPLGCFTADIPYNTEFLLWGKFHYGSQLVKFPPSEFSFTSISEIVKFSASENVKNIVEKNIFYFVLSFHGVIQLLVWAVNPALLNFHNTSVTPLVWHRDGNVAYSPSGLGFWWSPFAIGIQVYWHSKPFLQVVYFSDDVFRGGSLGSIIIVLLIFECLVADDLMVLFSEDLFPLHTTELGRWGHFHIYLELKPYDFFESRVEDSNTVKVVVNQNL